MKSTISRPRASAGGPLRRARVCLHTCKASHAETASLSQGLAHGLQEEVVIEGLLHVTAVQAGNCLERFSDIENLTAPPLQPLSTALQDTTNSNSSKVVSEAVCLATPPDNPTETENGGQVVRQLQGQSSNGRGSISSVAGNRSAGVRAAALQSEAEDLAALEAHVCERTVMFNMYTAEVLQASADIRRQRRRAMVRAIRASRQTARAILAAPQVALASCLASLDGAVGTADEQ